MRVLLCTQGRAGEALQTALLQDGHHVHRLAQPAGPLAALAAWQARRAATAFRPDLVLDLPGTDAAALAARLGVRFAAFEDDPSFLLDRFPPAPFEPATGPVPTLGLAAIELSPEHAALPVARVSIDPAAGEIGLGRCDIVLLGEAAGHLLADCMAAGCAVATPASLARLATDPDERHRAARHARQEFEARHHAARAALRQAARARAISPPAGSAVPTPPPSPSAPAGN